MPLSHPSRIEPDTLSHIPTIQLVQSLKQIERHSRTCKRAILHFNFLMDTIEAELKERAKRAAKAFNVQISCKP